MHEHDHPHPHEEPVFRESHVIGLDAADIAAELADDARVSDARRTMFAGLSVEDLERYHSKAWDDRDDATNRTLAATEELLCRLIASHYPHADRVVLVEDNSHGGPHAHLHSVVSSDGEVLLDGFSDEWHDLEWSGEADDHIYDLYLLKAASFNSYTEYRPLRVRILPAHVAV